MGANRVGWRGKKKLERGRHWKAYAGRLNQGNQQPQGGGNLLRPPGKLSEEVIRGWKVRNQGEARAAGENCTFLKTGHHKNGDAGRADKS